MFSLPFFFGGGGGGGIDSCKLPMLVNNKVCFGSEITKTVKELACSLIFPCG